MRILYICADRGIPLFGTKGASVHVRSLTAAFGQLGHQVVVAVARLGTDPTAPHSEVLVLDPDADVQLRQLGDCIDSFRPDLVIERYSLQSGAARQATARCGLPLTLEVNAPLVREATRHRGLRDPHAQPREEQALATADRIHVVSSELLRYVRSVAPRVPSAWIPNGADVDAFSSAPPGDIDGVAGRLVVGFTGSMKPWHGVDDLLDAFAALPTPVKDAACLLIVGTGPDEASLRARASRPDLNSRVHFCGHIQHHEVPRIVQLFDVAVAPYRPMDDFYFHPLKVVEYLAAGKATVYSQQGDIAELVGAAGLGYRAGDIAGLTSRLAELLLNAGLRRRLEGAARQERGGHRWTTTARRVIEFATCSAPPTASPWWATVRSAWR